MKLSELRPCDHCGGKIAPMFYRVRVDLALIRPAAVKATFGIASILGGLSPASLSIAEAMTPEPDAVAFAGDQEPSLVAEFLICNDCYLMKPIDLAILTERRREAERAQAAAEPPEVR